MNSCQPECVPRIGRGRTVPTSALEHDRHGSPAGLPERRRGRLADARRALHAQGLRPRLPLHGTGGRGGGPDAGGLRQGVPDAPPLPGDGRAVRRLADGGRPQPRDRPLPARTPGADAADRGPAGARDGARGGRAPDRRARARGAREARAHGPAVAARRTCARRSCSATCRGCRTTRSPPSCSCRSAPSRAASTGPASSSRSGCCDAAPISSGTRREGMSMDCRRAEELFSDHLEGTLHAVLARRARAPPRELRAVPPAARGFRRRGRGAARGARARGASGPRRARGTRGAAGPARRRDPSRAHAASVAAGRGRGLRAHRARHDARGARARAAHARGPAPGRPRRRP